MKLNKKALAIATGLLIGVGFFTMTFIFIIFKHEGFQLAKIHVLFIGYKVVWWGAFLGLIWGFVYGAIGGWILAWLYNKLEK